MPDTKNDNQDPTENPKFKRVVDHFLKTPPKPRKPLNHEQRPKAEIDDSKLVAAIGDLKRLLDSIPPHSVDHFSDILDVFAENTQQLVIVKGKGLSATRAPGDKIFLEPSALFKKVMAALRTRAAELDISV